MRVPFEDGAGFAPERAPRPPRRRRSSAPDSAGRSALRVPAAGPCCVRPSQRSPALSTKRARAAKRQDRHNQGVLIKALAGLLFIAGAAMWAFGAWSIYDGDETLGAVLALAGAAVCIALVAWWRGDRTTGIQGVIEVVGQFFSRG